MTVLEWIFGNKTTVCAKFGPNESVHIPNEHLLKIVDSSISYPHSNIDDEIKSTRIRLEYSCIDNRCNFADAIEKIRNSGDLKGMGAKDLSELTMRVVAEHPVIFPSSDLGGYVLQTWHRSYLFLENCTPGIKERSLDKEHPLTYGFANVSVVRSMIESEAFRIKAADERFWTNAALFGMFFFGSGIYALRKLK
jgi:hypothetical protein